MSNLKQTQEQKLKLSVKQILQANLLQLNAQLLEQRILKEISDNPFPDHQRGPSQPANPNLVSAVEKNKFYKDEGVAVILESRSGWIAAVRGFARPGAKIDVYDRNETLNHLPIVAVTPEHYNRMYRIAERGIKIKIDIEISTTVGQKRRDARNVLGRYQAAT